MLDGYAQVQLLLGWYAAIIFPRQGLITLAASHNPSVSGGRGLRRSGSCCQAESICCGSCQQMQREGGAEELWGGPSKYGCYGKITRGFIS